MPKMVNGGGEPVLNPIQRLRGEQTIEDEQHHDLTQIYLGLTRHEGIGSRPHRERACLRVVRSTLPSED